MEILAYEYNKTIMRCLFINDNNIYIKDKIFRIIKATIPHIVV